MVKSISTTPIGNFGLSHHAGYINEELHPKLRGRTAMRIYEEMATNSPVISAALFSIEGFLRRVKWRVDPASDTPRAVEAADFITSCMHDMEQSWEEVIAEALTMLPYGFALGEVVYKYRRGADSKSPRFNSRYKDNKIGWRCIALRKQTTIERWDIDDDGYIHGCWQDQEKGTAYLPISHCVLYRTSTVGNNPEGRSLLRGAYRPWYFNKRLEEVEAVGMVRSLVNLPRFEIPARFMSPNATPEEKAVRREYEKMASLISKDQLTGLVLPSERDESDKPTGYRFTLVGASGAQLATDPVIRRYDARQMMTLAAEFMLLGSEKTGSFALAAEKSSNFKVALERFASIIRNELQKQINKLLRINGYDEADWCVLHHDNMSEPSVAELGLFLAQAANYLTPDLNTEQHLRERANLPYISEEDYEAGKEVQQQAPQEQKIDKDVLE